MKMPLEGIVVLEFSQYLSGPCGGLRLADLGARVIKIEKPVKGDDCRRLSIKNLWVDESSLLFHTINRNKESFAADLKDAGDLQQVKQLITRADVITHNFRPGVMEKIGLDYPAVQQINPRIIYAVLSGYGQKGPWSRKPGQDLLIQSLSGLTHTTGNRHDAPLPFGLAIADYLAGNQMVQGILAALIRRHKTGKGALVELSLLESLIDFQFEFFTTYFETQRHHQRSAVNNGHSLLSAPYGIYHTADGYIAIAMMPLESLNKAIQCEALKAFAQEDAFAQRDEIKAVLGDHFIRQTTAAWMEKMRVHGLWAMPVLNWRELRSTPTYQALQMEQEITAGNKKIITIRCPIRINRKKFISSNPAPAVGEHNEKIRSELL